jgi:osmoprotectant transport system substrate-binding protein
MRRGKGLRLMTLLLVGLLLLGACSGDDDETGDATGSLAQEYDLSGANFTVGSKEFTEQLVLGHITRLALEAAGADVKEEIGLEGSAVARTALLSGDIDMYWEYTGTGWITHLGEEAPVPDAAEQYEAVAKRDLEEKEIRWLEPAPFNNTYALAFRSEAAEDLGVASVSDFATLVQTNPQAATLCAGTEFSARDDGLPGLEQHYGFEISDKHLALMQDAVIYSRVDKGNPCNFGVVFTTDGRIASLGLTVLEDDQDFFPKFNPALTVRDTVFSEHPELEGLFATIARLLDEATMTRLNALVDNDGQSPEDVAADWLEQEGLTG